MMEFLASVEMINLLIEAMRASVTGVLIMVLLYMVCHRQCYNRRDFGIVSALLVSVLVRYNIGYPPPTHIFGITLLNVIFVWVAAMVWARPSKIPPVEREPNCFLSRWLTK